MPTLEQLSVELVAEFKTVRLRALQDTPSAFTGTYLAEAKLSDQDWLTRVATWNGSHSICYLGMGTSGPCGIIAGYFDKSGLPCVWVASMWVAPEHRRTGLGTMLMDAIARWAHNQGAGELRLMVTSGNASAMSFYERCGYAFTGMVGPYPNDPELKEHEMVKHLKRVR